MPIHFKDLTEFQQLITLHNVREVIVSENDFNFLWDRVEPNFKGPGYKLTIRNLRGQPVKVISNLTGILDLIGIEIVVIKDK